MLIGLAGVTSTGKSTMANAIKERYGDNVVILNKISRQEIFDYAGLKIDKDLRKAREAERAVFDIARVELQIKREREYLEANPKVPVIIDGCAIVKVAYMIYLSAPYIVQYFDEAKLSQVVESGLNHVNDMYSSIFYLPVARLPFKEADHRVFKNEYIRTGQDAILNRLLATKIKPGKVDVVRFDQADMNLVFDELSKMGVN